MLKKIVTLSLALAGTLAMQADQGGIVTANRVNVRNAPIRDAKILKILPKNAKLVVTARYDKPEAQKEAAIKEDVPTSWYQIRMGLSKVWVKSSYLDEKGVVKSDYLNVRQGPGTQHEKVGEFKKGEILNLTGNKENDWAEVKLEVYGFITAQYVELTGKISDEEIAQIAGYSVATASKLVNVAESAQKSGDSEKGAEVEGTKPTEQISEKAIVAETETKVNEKVENSAANIKIEPAKPVVEEKIDLVVEDTPLPAEEVNVDASNEIKGVEVKDEEPTLQPEGNKKLIAIKKETVIVSENGTKKLEPEVVELPVSEEVFTEVDKQVTEQKNLTPRVVRREGIVSTAGSPAAPSPYTLRNFQNGWRMNFLYVPSDSEIMLKKYLGKKVVVTGTEAIDSRWKDRPLLNIETIELYSEE